MINKLIGVVVLLLLLAFALPALVSAVDSLIVPLIVITFIVGVGGLLFRRRRHW